MSLVLHLVRWDVRRFRLLLLLWLLVVSLSAVLEGAWPAMAVARTAHNTVGIAGNLLALVEALFSIVLVALVVQEHPLGGTTAFWMTRPIPPPALLAAKVVVLIAAIVFAPVIAEIVLMSIYAVPIDEIAAVAAQSAVFWVLWLAIVMAFSALTRNIASFALAASGVIVTLVVSIVTITSILIDGGREGPPIPTAQPMYDPTADTVSTLVIVAGVMVSLMVLYRTRARPRAIAIGLAAFALSWVAGSVWPWPFLAPTTETPSWALDSSALQLTAGPVPPSAENSIAFGVASPAWHVVRSPMRLSGLAPSWSAGVGVRETFIRVEGREPLRSSVRGAPASVAIDDAQSVQNHEVVRRLLSVNRLVTWMQQTKAESAVVLVARASDLRQLAADSVAYEGRFQLSLARHIIEAVLPLRHGSATRVGSYRFGIDSVQLLPNRIRLLARESDARSVFNRHPRSRLDYYLRNSQTSEAVHAIDRELRTDVTLSRFIPFAVGLGESENAGFRPRAKEVSFSTGYGGKEELLFDQLWLDHGELVIVRSIEEGAVERRISIAQFPIGLQ